MALFDHGCAAVTTTAAKIFSSSQRKVNQYLLVRANPDNTDDIYVGSGAGVVADKTDADDCGFPLQAGESRTFPINESQDADGEDTLYAIAASGTQYLHWELK